MLPWLGIVAGLIILIVAGDLLVRGAVNLALRLGVSALIVSLTVVAFGTSAPEFLVVLRAMQDQAPGLALGNVIGSNTANILLVLGVPALVAGLHTNQFDTRKSYGFMIAASVVFIALAFWGPFRWWHALILLAILGTILTNQFRERRKPAGASTAPDGEDPAMRGWKIAAFVVLGLVGLPLGAALLVDNAVIIARNLGVSETVIGLTLVAVGTSLPELATTTMAALRRQADVALGNVIGSNMFNLLAIVGLAALIGPIPVDTQFLHFDLWIMLGASMLLIPFVFTRQNITRWWGMGLTLAYAAYVLIILV